MGNSITNIEIYDLDNQNLENLNENWGEISGYEVESK